MKRTATDLESSSYWLDKRTIAKCDPLDRDERCDVLVVGAGIAGLTAAYLLSSAGRDVVVLDRADIGGVDSTCTTAHLTMVTDTSLSELVDSLGRDHAQALWDAGLAAINQIDQIVRGEGIECDFAWVPGYLHATAGASSDVLDRLRRDAEAAHSMGFDADFVGAVPFAGTAGIKFADQARFHPGKYLTGLADAILANGGRIYARTAAEKFDDKPMRVAVGPHHVACDRIVVATHNPLVGESGIVSATLLQTKLALYSTYVIAGTVEKGSVPDGLYWDTGDPYHYLRLQPMADRDLVIFGGEDHKTGQADDTRRCYERLERTLREKLPSIRVTHRWSGQVIETPDGLPYIGEQAERQFAATGFSGNGMTFGTLAGMIVRDAIVGIANPWRELLALDRKRLGAAWDYVKENRDYPYYLIRDRLAGSKFRTLRSIARGQGRITEHQGQRVAAYRDADGALTLRSAVCTHMGCIVGWNAAEKTWDCPCHGSRFLPDGSVMSGPAEAPLAEVPPEEV
jgi:glycine/D-amino acid oxidase-like deaminating enzyme/nitrite reductase/ring-hydroxylating ferredoxin subunit